MSGGERTQWRVALLVVIVTGLIMGFFVWKTYFDYVPALYPLAFNRGQWLMTATEDPQGYFRKELHIPSNLLQAVVMVAATDSFALYVNGRTIDVKAQALLQVSGIYDIGPHLHPGKNVIALATRRLTYPGPAKVALEGLWFDQAGQDHVIASDSSWKASLHEDSQADGGIPWNATEFSAEAWAFSRTSGLPSPAEVAPVPVHPDVLRSFPRGKWIGHADSRPHLARFFHTFEVTQRVQGAWVRVAAADSFDLAINGFSVASAGASKPTFDIYDIGPFLQRGTNTIVVNVTAVKGASARLLLDGFIDVSGQLQPILATDSTWIATEPSATVRNPAIVLTSYPAVTPNLVKSLTATSWPISYTIRYFIYMLVIIGSFLGLMIISWRASSLFLHHIGPDLSSNHAAKVDALLHLPSIFFLGVVFLLQYDIRFDRTFPFQEKFVYIACGILVILRAITFLNHRLPTFRSASLHFSSLRLFAFNSKFPRILRTIGVVAIILSGMALRLYDLDGKSLSHDEAGLPIRANAVLERGYPFNTIGPIEKPVTTYELLPYPIALSVTLFGETDFSVRLPAAMFGTLTILLIFHIGNRLWGVGTGFLAAAIYAFSPFALTWGSNAFHPQQTQFFALLTSYVFYRALTTETTVISPKYLYVSSLCLILSYLSWEPSAFLVPTLFIGLLIVKGRDFRWVKSRHLWLCVLIVGTVIFLQLSFRILLNVPYIVVGKGLSDTMITLFFIDPLYNPWFYFDKFFLSGPHIPMSLMVMLSLPLIYKNRTSIYYLINLSVPFILLTNLIPNQSTRYTYFLLPYLILLSSTSCVSISTFLWNLYVPPLRLYFFYIRSVICYTFPLIFFFSTSSFPSKLYNLGYSSEWVTQMIKWVYDTDYRATAYFIEKYANGDDIIISMMPHTLNYYIKRKSDYYLQTYTSRQVFYDVSEVSGDYLDKYIGSPVIRNLSELMDVLYRHRRVWIVAAPVAIFELSNERKVLDYIREHSKIVYETYKARVYLWQH